jgi:hypothetical protein
VRISLFVLSQVVAACKGVSADVNNVLTIFDRKEKVKVKEGVVADGVGVHLGKLWEDKMLGATEI